MPQRLPRALRGRRIGPAAVLAGTAVAAAALVVTPLAARQLNVSDLARSWETGAVRHSHVPEKVAAAERIAAQRAAAVASARRAARGRSLAVSDTGSWGAPLQSPVRGIHAIMLPTGKVMYFGNQGGPGAFNQFGGSAEVYLWDPQTGLWEDVPPPIDPYNGKPANIFCSGHTFLPDGRLVVAGGNQEWPVGDKTYKGLRWILTFNPFTETWTRQPDMADGRWYPTLTTLSDGRVVIFSGLDATGDQDAQGRPSMNETVEVFTPSPDMDGVGTVAQTPSSATRYTEFYPHLFTLPGDRVLLAGQNSSDTAILNTQTWVWEDIPDLPVERLWSTAVLDPYDGATGPRYVTVNGGLDSGTLPTADGRSYRMDLQNPAAGWTALPTMVRGRSHHNLQLLPDGSSLAVGGGTGIQSPDGLYSGPVFTTEILRPDGTPVEVPGQTQRRTYHSTTVLLPDGRVVSGGDDFKDVERPIEVYSPPYLHRGPRPVISAVPAAVTFGETFRVDTPNAGQVTSAVLIAPGATTHSTDMNQRAVRLPVSQAGGGALNLVAPAGAQTAPRGYYMLFLVNSQGIPSPAAWVRLTDQTTPDLPTPPPPTAPGGGTGATSRPGATPAAGGGATARTRRPAIGTTRFQRIRGRLYVVTRVNTRGLLTVQTDAGPRPVTLLRRTVARPQTVRVRVRRVLKPGDRIIVRLKPRSGKAVLRLISTRTTLRPVVAVRRK